MAASSTYTPIATYTADGSSNNVTLSSIPSNYTDLRLICSGFFVVGYQSTFFRLNGDSSSNYSWNYMYGDGTNAVSGKAASQSTGFLQMSGNQSNVIVDFYSYSNTSVYKTYVVRQNGASDLALAAVNLWRSTAAINSIYIQNDYSGNIGSGTTFTLYGIAAA
jgi:hypothetical protein